MHCLVRVIWMFIVTSCSVLGQIRYTVLEEKVPGTYIGNVATDLSLDIKTTPIRQFQIVPSIYGQHFDINPVTGRLLIKDRIDREHLCGTSLSCVMNFDIKLENPIDIHRVEVNILDINDNAPTFGDNDIVLNILETVAPGARFQVERAYDPDIGINSISTYQLSTNKYFVLKYPNPGDSNELPELLLEIAFDREQEKRHLLTMTAYDGGYQRHSAVAKITINVVDANDNPPVFNQSQYTAVLKENTPKGTLVIHLNATDLDEGANAEIIYAFTASTAPKVQETFILDSNTGVITLNGSVDFEHVRMYELFVRATNKGAYSEAAHCKVIVQILDVNDNSPEITLTSVSNSIPEDAPVGTVVALINVADKDFGPNGRVNCRISDNLPFQLKSSLNNYYTLVTRNILDRELTAEYNFPIWATDQGIPIRSSYKTINIQVKDVNDNPPSFPETYYEVYITENNVPGAIISRITAEDSDLGQNAQISYSFIGNQITGEPLSTYFSVGTENGDIYALASLDYEKTREYQFQIQARDAGVPQLSSTVTVHVYVVDANDNAPKILYPFPGKGLEGINRLPRAAKPGHLVAKVSAVDSDVGHNALLSYQLFKSDIPEIFSISNCTGEIRTTRQFQSNDSSSYTLVIMVKDNGQPALSATTVIHLSLIESAPDVVPKIDREFSSQGNISDINVYLIICLVSVIFLFFVIVSLTVALRCCNTTNLDLPHSLCCIWRKDTFDTWQQANIFLPSQCHQGLQTYVEVHGRTSAYEAGTYRLSVPQDLKDDFITIDLPRASNSNPCIQQFQKMYLLYDESTGPLSSSQGMIQQRWSGTLGQQMQAV